MSTRYVNYSSAQQLFENETYLRDSTSYINIYHKYEKTNDGNDDQYKLDSDYVPSEYALSEPSCLDSSYLEYSISNRFSSGEELASYISENEVIVGILPGAMFQVPELTIDSSTTLSNVKFVVLGVNTYIKENVPTNTGTSATKNHIVCMPIYPLYTILKIKTSNGGFLGTSLYSVEMPKCDKILRSAFGDDHLLSVSLNLSADDGYGKSIWIGGLSYSYVNTEVYSFLPSANEVCGTKGWGYAEDYVTGDASTDSFNNGLQYPSKLDTERLSETGQLAGFKYSDRECHNISANLGTQNSVSVIENPGKSYYGFRTVPSNSLSSTEYALRTQFKGSLLQIDNKGFVSKFTGDQVGIRPIFVIG